MKERLKNLSNKKIVITSLCAFAIVLLLGFTYALWDRTFTQTGENVSIYDCFDVSFTENSEGITMENGYPISDEEGLQTDAYEVTIENTCNTAASYNVILNKLNTSTLDDSHIKVAVNDDIKLLSETNTTTSNVENVSEARIIKAGILAGKAQKTIEVRSWMDENTSIEEGSNKSLNYKITIEAVAGKNSLLAANILEANKIVNVVNYRKEEPNYTNEIILAQEDVDVSFGSDNLGSYTVLNEDNLNVLMNNYGKYISNFTSHENITSYTEDTIGKYICGENTSDLCQDEIYKIRKVENGIVTKADRYVIAIDNSNSGIILTNDDDGLSYVLRGQIANNYVSFANSIWRVVRINGDGTIRMMKEETIGKSSYNSKSSKIEYFGYTYNNDHICTINNYCTSNSGTSSTIKQYLEDWYVTNLSSYDSKIALSNYCNDTSSNDKNEEYTSYNVAKRFSISSEINLTLQCPNTTENYGGVYKLKIGLLSADEMAYAGVSFTNGFQVPNLNYLAKDLSYYTMTPYDFTYYLEDEYMKFSQVYFSSSISRPSLQLTSSIKTKYDVFPVINLKSDTIITSGDGTQDNPYVIE